MILLIGPRRNKHKSQIGGSEVLFENWIEFSKKNELEIEVIDGNKFNYRNRLAAIFLIVFNIFRKAPKCEKIFLHGSKNDFLVLAPIAVLAGKFYNKPVCLKKFGGSFNTVYDTAPWWKKVLYRYGMQHADVLFWETKYLVDFGKKFNNNSFWFPNARPRPNKPLSIHPFNKRFVFISQVRKEKGVDVILKIFRELGSDYHIDIYGSLMGYEDSQLGGHYKGILEPNAVYDTLSEYDVLLLPTLWPHEGYPGIIAESFAVGRPVIAFDTGGISEMIVNRKNGILVPSGDSSSFLKEIVSINQDTFKKLVDEAYKSFDDYDADKVNERICKLLNI